MNTSASRVHVGLLELAQGLLEVLELRHLAVQRPAAGEEVRVAEVGDRAGRARILAELRMRATHRIGGRGEAARLAA